MLSGRVAPAAALVLACAVSAHSQAVAGQSSTTALATAYDLAYNLDHDSAMRSLRQAVQEHPRDPAAYRGIASLAWLRMLFLSGAVVVDAQLTATVRSSVELLEPRGDLTETFYEHIEKAIELSEAQVKDNEDDPAAQYQLGASLGLLASYKASIEGEGLRALRDAKRAYEAHQRVMELDPERSDAGFTIGIYRYLVSLLPRAVRMMAYLVGFDGGREEALALIERAAAYPGESQVEAKFALVLIHSREREYADAQRVLSQLKRQFPRNRLLWLESAATWLRDDRAELAERELARGFAMLSEDGRARMQSEDEMWMLKRGTVRVALRRIEDARPDLEIALAADGKPWVQGRARVEFGKIADLEGDRRRARDEYDRGRKLCRESNDRRCARAAETLKKHGYPLAAD